MFGGKFHYLLVESRRGSETLLPVHASPRRLGIQYGASAKITPVCTDTPKSARKPTPDETLRFVCVMSKASSPPSGAMATFVKMRSAHLTDVNIAYRMTKIATME